MAFKHPIERYLRSDKKLSLRTIFWTGLLAMFIGGGAFFYFNIWPSIQTADKEAALQTLTYLESQSKITPDNGAAPAVSDISQPEGNLGSITLTEQRIIFPNAETAGRIIPVYLKNGSWDVSNLQQLVGHLERTAWLDRPGNIVLAGHFEDQYGNPGPFRYLYSAQIGDHILLQDGDLSVVFEVTEVFSTPPDNLEVLRGTPEMQLTLITCDDWNFTTQVYEERLIVIAEPVALDEVIQ